MGGEQRAGGEGEGKSNINLAALPHLGLRPIKALAEG